MNIINKFVGHIKAMRKKRQVESANAVIQIEELNGELWLVCNGFFVSPFKLITPNCTTEECIDLLKKLRELYCSRNYERNKEHIL